MRKRLVVLPAVFLCSLLSTLAQNPPANPAARPLPRWTDGRINLGAPLGEKGVWQGNGRLVINPNSYEPNATKSALIHINEVPLQPWARALVNERHGNSLTYEPHPRCKPSGGPRQFVTPYGIEIVDLPEQRRVYIFDIGGPHSYRIVHMDGRAHPKDFLPSYYGHSTGSWEGDTLVIDTVGFNEEFWMNRDGLPHTDRLHLIERVTRMDFRTLRYEVIIDDPGAYSATWKSGFNLTWTDGAELFEYICQDNNLFSDATLQAPGATSPTVPIFP